MAVALYKVLQHCVCYEHVTALYLFVLKITATHVEASTYVEHVIDTQQIVPLSLLLFLPALFPMTLPLFCLIQSPGCKQLASYVRLKGENKVKKLFTFLLLGNFPCPSTEL